jgi:hypothetical protein
MKRTVLLVVLALVMLSSFSAAAAAEDVYASDTEWLMTGETAKSLRWHYAPEFTGLDSQGRMDTWLKAKYVGCDTQYSRSGEYTIYHILLTPDFEKFMNTEWSDFRPDDTLMQTHIINDAKWRDLPRGDSFEKCLQAAYSYAKNK